ncbi:AAA family ATPase [Pseudomonas palleroniana]
MLVQFAVTNYMSFREEAVLSLLAAKRKSKDKDLDTDSTFDTPFGLKLLKTAVIYGANASGKSNIFKAMRFMKNFVINSSKESQQDEEIDTSPFLLNTATASAPSKFSAIFIKNGTLYEYSFATTKEKITEESLKIKNNIEEREKTLFSRNHGKITVTKLFPEGKGLEKRTRDNALFLSVCANFDGNVSASVISWFKSVRVVSGIADAGMLSFTSKKLKNAESNDKILNLLESFDVGISKIKINEVSEESLPGPVREFRAMFEKNFGTNMKLEMDLGQIITEHKVYDDNDGIVGNIDFNLDKHESEGTKKLVAMSGPIIEALEKSLILFIDELDARLHPLLSLQLLKLFNCSHKNTNNAQLITATHSTNLLDKDILRRDQIWLTSKNMPGESTITSLVEYRVRNDASFEKDYLLGKYGAIPLVNELDHLF